MPEGLEIFILSKVLNDLGFVCEAYGKHLFLTHPYTGELFDFTFGLAGRLKISEKNLDIEKVNHPKIVSGGKEKIPNKKVILEKLGIDWIRATREDVEAVVRGWLSRKRQVGALLIDQKELCGIGVAWASEILNLSKISPGLKSNLLQCLNLVDKLVDSILAVRDKFLKIYLHSICIDKRKFVNSWFYNLYEVRKPHLKVYGKAEKIKISGREFYVSISEQKAN